MIDDIADPRYRRMLNQKEFRTRMEQEAEEELRQAESNANALALSKLEEENSLYAASLKSSEDHSRAGGGGMLGKKKKPTGDWSGKKAPSGSVGASAKDLQLAKKQADALTPEALEMEEW